MSATTLGFDYIDSKTHYKIHLPLSVFKKPSNEKEYAKLEIILDKLIDTVRDDEKHPLNIAMQIIGDNLEQYDDENHPIIGKNVTEIEMVKHLIKSNNLHQEDLANIFGGQANVSKFLNGIRSLSKSQILGLKKKFGISADFFVK